MDVAMTGLSRIRKPLSRRDYRKTSAGITGAAAAAAGCGSRTQPDEAGGIGHGMAASSIPVGVYMFCFLHRLVQDFEGTLAQVAAIGFNGVESAGCYGCSAADPQRSINVHEALGNSRLIVPGIGDDRRAPTYARMRTTKEHTATQETLRAHGMGTDCHADSVNAPAKDRTIWDILAENALKDLIMQPDTGNAANGGADAPAVIRSSAGEIHSIYVKPCTHGAELPSAPFIGDTSLQGPDIFGLSESEGGIKGYVAENEDASHPPLAALKTNSDRVHDLRRVVLQAG